MMKETVTIREVATTAITLFTNDCKEIAEKNWSKSQVEMLDRLFMAVVHGCEYKCVGCEYLCKAADAPETAEEECMWIPSEENGEQRPCEEE